jgi:hypothetical protein
MAPYGDARRAPVWASWHICRVYENVFPLLSNLYGPVRMLVVRGITRLSREFVTQTKLEGTMAPRGLFEKPMNDLDDGSKGGTGSIMVFGLVAAIMLVMLIFIGVAGKNVAPKTAQLNTESPAASGSQNP